METIELARGGTFNWMLQGDEIYGYVTDAWGAIISGGSGWYRTDNPEVAADLADYAIRA